MPRPRVHDQNLRARLLDQAARMVAADGVRALTLRALATASATSTTAVYALFGSKAELLQALFRAAFDSFGDAQRAAPVTDDPMADLYELGHAYRNWALANPHLYDVMFGGALAGVEPDQESQEASLATMQPLRSAVTRGCAAGLLGHAETDTIVLAIWAGVHGLVSLELTLGIVELPIGRRDALYDAALAAIVRGWRR